MKKLFTLFLAVIIVSQALTGVGIVVYYHLNKVYITQKLCENRNNPKLHCNGRCYLGKQLKNAEEQEQKQTGKVLKEKEELVSFSQRTVVAKYFSQPQVIRFRHNQSILYSSGSSESLLKPPAA